VPEAQADHRRRVVGYYSKPESRLSYRLLLGGTKHFGYYPDGAGGLSMATAMRRMEDKLGATLDLPPGVPGPGRRLRPGRRRHPAADQVRPGR
jgi:hypothetical protein